MVLPVHLVSSSRINFTHRNKCPLVNKLTEFLLFACFSFSFFSSRSAPNNTALVTAACWGSATIPYLSTSTVSSDKKKQLLSNIVAGAPATNARFMRSMCCSQPLLFLVSFGSKTPPPPALSFEGEDLKRTETSPLTTIPSVF